MKKNIFKILALMLLVCTVFTMVACDKLPFDIPGITDKGGDNNNNDNNNGGNNDNGGTGTTDTAVDKLALVEGGKAKFQVVFTEASAAAGAEVASTFVERLKKMGALPKDAEAVSDLDTDKVKDCEIIIGAEAKNRGSECSISTKLLGKDGEMVKVVGNRVIIATGSEGLLNKRFQTFVRGGLGISNNATSIADTLTLDRSYSFEKFTEYVVTSITVNGNDMKDYVFILDVSDAKDESLTNINAFRNELYEASGYWLELGDVNKIDTYDNAFIVRCVDDAGASGFRAYVEENGNFIVECAYNNAFDGAFGDFAANTFTSKRGDLAFAYSTQVNAETQLTETVNVYEKNVSIAYYEDFGAVGNGVNCCFEAIYNTHVYANRGGQKVMSRGGASAVYYINPKNFTKSIPVMTDVDLNQCTFRVDDTGTDAYAYYNTHFFRFERDIPEVIFTDHIKNVPVLDANGNPKYNSNGTPQMTTDNLIDDERFQGIKLMNKTEANKDDPNVYDDFSWLVEAGELSYDALIRVYNSKHRDFVRHGSNQNSGNVRTDVFVVSADGTIDESTPIAYEFESISKIEIFRIDDKPITFENGNFINVCCKTIADTTYTTPSGVLTKYACKWRGYQRTLGIFRTNVTIKNLTHKMEDEPAVGYIPNGSGYIKDTKHNNYGSRHESYPYYGFFYIYTTYNFHAYDSTLTGHTTYYEDKPATASTGGKIPDPVAMGTYDLIVEYSSHVYLHNVVQVNSSTPNTGIGDGRYWGIMSSNGARNMFFYDCVINRFDAHRGFWNAELYNTVIGHSFQVVGGGYLIADGVTKVTKGNFMTFRGDYGATFNGDIILKDCVQQGFNTYNTARNQKNTTLDNADRSVMDKCCIFDPQYAVTNSGWTDTDNSGAYWLWDFGYTCYMPRHITIENFTYGCNQMCIFDELPDIIFEKTYDEEDPNFVPNENTVRYPYQITEKVTFIGYTPKTGGLYENDAKVNNALVMTFHDDDNRIKSIATEFKAPEKEEE